MLPEDIDSLFRNQLDGHQSPPGDDLWARLQAQTQLPAAPDADAAPVAERNHLDELFRARLSQHTITPPRALWERLEDEHLHPRKRRAAAWWPLAIAASVALFLLVGGGLLWQGLPGGLRAGTGSVAGLKPSRTTPATSRPPISPAAASATAPASADGLASAAIEQVEKNINDQATGAGQSSSSAPEGQGTASRRPVTRFGQSARTAQPTPAMLAARQPRQSGPTASSRAATANHLPATGAVPVVPVPDAPAVAQVAPAPAPASSEVIEVEVRRGGSPAVAVAAPAADDSDAPEASRRLGRLFQRAGGAVRLAKNGLAAAQNIPDNLTVQARLGNHTLSKTIEL